MVKKYKCRCGKSELTRLCVLIFDLAAVLWTLEWEIEKEGWSTVPIDFTIPRDKQVLKGRVWADGSEWIQVFLHVPNPCGM